jgi:hypothetical protein
MGRATNSLKKKPEAPEIKAKPVENGLTETDRQYLRDQGLNPDDYEIAPEQPSLSDADRQYLIDQGLNPDDYEVEAGNEPYKRQEGNVVYYDDDTPINVEKIDREAPASLRARVSGLNSQEDRLRAVRSFAPDAQPFGDGNYIMTDPETNKPMLFNSEGWIPSLGDAADLIPDAVGGVTGALTGIAGAAVGAPSGPVGSGAGAISGGATGYAAGRQGAQSGLNWWFGDDDTRDLGDKLTDSGKDLLVGATGEVAGPLATKAAGAAIRGVGSLAGRAVPNVTESMAAREVGKMVDDPAVAAQRLQTFNAGGIEPTPGMIGGAKVAQEEAQAARNLPAVRENLNAVDEQFANRWDGLRKDMTGGADLTPAEAGSRIRETVGNLSDNVKQKTSIMFDNVGEKTDGLPAVGKAIDEFFDGTAKEFSNAGKSVKLNLGTTYEDVLAQTDALRADIKAGTGFDALKEARTRIGEIAFDRNAPAATRNLYGRLYGAITKDMEATAAQGGEDALSAWKRATHFSKRTFQDDTAVSQPAMQKLLKKDTPESLYRLISSGVKNNGTKVNDILKQVRLGGGQDAVQEIFSTTINKLGVNKQGEFNPTRWLTDYDGWSNEAKDAFFRHAKGGAKLREEADKFRAAVKELTEYQSQVKAGAKDRTLAKAGVEWANKMVADKTVGAFAGIASGGHSVPLTGAVIAKNALVSRAQSRMFTNPETLKFMTRSISGESDKAVVGSMRKFVRTARDESAKAILRSYLQSIGETE